MSASANARVVLRAAGVGLVLDVSRGDLPSVLHWGADIGAPSENDLGVLADAGMSPVAPNTVDEPMRVSLLPEHWRGWTGRPGLSGSRAGRSWSPKFTTTSVEVDGQVLPASSAEPTLAVVEGGGRVLIDAVDDEAALALSIELEQDSAGIVRMRAAVTNTGADEYQVDELLLGLPVPQTASEILDFAGRWGMERVPQRGPVQVGAHRREGRHGRTGADSAYVMHVGSPGFGFADGDVWAVHTGWSGNHVHQVERLLTGEQVLAGGELLLPGEVRLGEGETYWGPWVYAAYGRGLDAIARRFHASLRGRPQHPRTPRPVTLNVWEAVYFDQDFGTLRQLADMAARVGVERFVLDDGWFGSRRDDRSGLGDWAVSPDVWPDGLRPLVDHVRGLGMEFGLWFEPEMVNPDSDVARAHPEWIMQTGGRLPVESRFQHVLNLSIRECFDHVLEAISAVLRDYDITYVKWDHNRDLVDAGTAPTGEPGVHAQTLAVYRLMDELKVRFPGLEIESCSSGGARVDLGVLERTDRVWVSDNIDPHDRQLMNRWTTQLIPPELMGSHIASEVSHTTSRHHSLSFRAATAVFGHLGIEWDLRQASEDDLDELTDWVHFYKEHRALLHGGDLVRVDHPDETIVMHGVVAPDRSEAVYSFAVTGRSELVTPGRMRFPGLDPERRYRVEPVLIRHIAELTRPPAWWGIVRDGEMNYYKHAARLRWKADGENPGVELPGALIIESGLAAPLLQPDHAILYRVVASD